MLPVLVMKNPCLAPSVLLLTLSCLAGVAQAQDYDAPGPHPVGWREAPLPFDGGLILNRVYYPATASGQDTPADPAAGPYPLVCLIHGATIGPDYYDVLTSHVVSHGYVVASLGRMTQSQETYINMSRQTKELADWLATESADPGSPYAGLLDAGPIGVIGSSRGGGASELFVGHEPRTRAAALLEPTYISGQNALANLAAWDGAWLFVAGELDSTNPPAEVKRIRNAATGAARRVYVEMLGAGHAGALDPDVPGLPNNPLPHAVQLALHSRLVVAFLEAQLRGREDAYDQIIGGEAAADPLEHESTCVQPPLWAIERGPAPGALTLGVAGRNHDLAVLLVSARPASIPTGYGLFGLDPATVRVLGQATLTETGTHEITIPLHPGHSGLRLWTQAFVLNVNGRLSRTDEVVLP